LKVDYVLKKSTLQQPVLAMFHPRNIQGK
jgi:hypothetical protein